MASSILKEVSLSLILKTPSAPSSYFYLFLKIFFIAQKVFGDSSVCLYVKHQSADMPKTSNAVALLKAVGVTKVCTKLPLAWVTRPYTVLLFSHEHHSSELS